MGQAVIIDGSDLPAKFVIHAVGPIWRGGERLYANIQSYIDGHYVDIRRFDRRRNPESVFHAQQLAEQATISSTHGHLCGSSTDHTIAKLNFERLQTVELRQHLAPAILSFDGVTSYRLEMQARLRMGEAKDLYEFWGSNIAGNLFDETDCIVNLASKEYSRCVSAHLTGDVCSCKMNVDTHKSVV